jgi:hypothetical protein
VESAQSIKDLALPQFVLHKDRFSRIIDAWHTQVLPELGRVILESATKPLSCHLFGRGTTAEEAVPFVKVSTRQIPNTMEKHQWEESVMKLFPEDVLSEFGKLEVKFQQSSIRRTGAKNIDRPICEPKNTEFFDKPPFGASIGISGYTDHCHSWRLYQSGRQGSICPHCSPSSSRGRLRRDCWLFTRHTANFHAGISTRVLAPKIHKRVSRYMYEDANMLHAMQKQLAKAIRRD